MISSEERKKNSSLKQVIEEPGNLIEVRGAYKRYSPQNVVLRGLNMTVKKGTIYALLGSSGCGKTTLLTCVAGQGALDSGSITVNLESRKQLGYMPQDIALMELFSISEMFKYFGKVNGMTNSEIQERGRQLLNLMELPPERFWERAITSLSGGQQRRVSLCVALLHNPVLLILDEPTVGLDPLINESLWEYFIKITSEEGKTLIITTHYIEETRRAHTIGLMRNGVLLAEEAPLQLLENYKCDTLEDVFLLLSQKQSIVCVENDEMYPKKAEIKRPMNTGRIWDWKRLRAQIYKNSCWIRRNIPVMVFMLFLPALMQILYCTVYQDTLTGIDIAFVSEEVLPDSCLHPSDPNLAIPHCNPQSRISCHFVNMVGKMNYGMVEYDNFDSAYKAFLEGKVRAVMYFLKNYSWSVIRRLSEGPITPDRYVNSSIIDVYIDRAELTISWKIEKDIRDNFNDLVKFIMHECGSNSRVGDQVIRFEKAVYGDSRPKFTHSAMAGFIIPVAFYFTTFLSASSIASEKISGFLERCLVTGVNFVEVVGAHAVVQILMLIGQNAMMFTIAYWVYGLPLIGSWGLVILFIILVELQGMFYGFILGTLFDEEKHVSYISVGTVICLFLSCGMVWPLEGAHWIIHSSLQYFPLVMAVTSYHSITLRGWDLSHHYIVQSIFSNIGIILVLICIFLLVCRVKM